MLNRSDPSTKPYGIPLGIIVHPPTIKCVLITQNDFFRYLHNHDVFERQTGTQTKHSLFHMIACLHNTFFFKRQSGQSSPAACGMGTDTKSKITVPTHGSIKLLQCLLLVVQICTFGRGARNLNVSMKNKSKLTTPITKLLSDIVFIVVHGIETR